VFYRQLLAEKHLQDQIRSRAKAGKLRKSQPGVPARRGAMVNCKVVGGLAVSALLFASAFSIAGAADLPLNVPSVAVEPAPTWTGFYIGGTIGGGWGDDRVSNPVTSFSAGGFGCPAACGPAAAAATPPLYPTRPHGLLGGIEEGFNFQTGLAVFGVEADYSAAHIAGSNSQSATAQIAGLPAGDGFTGSGLAQQNLKSFGTVRGRLGVTPMPPVLLYATGGLAYGQVTSTTSLTLSPIGACGFCAPGTQSVTATGSLTGWTAGGGVEWMVAPHITIKAEYLYYDLGNFNYSGPAPISNIVTGGFPVAALESIATASAAAFKGNIVRVGGNYKF
jgi:outer membrane immunogenic protein